MGEYRRGEAVIVIPVRPTGGVDENDAGTTLHFPFTHPQLPAPQSSGPSQLAVQRRLQGRLAARAVQLDGWQHSAGTQSAALVHSATWTGDAVVTGVTGDNEGGTVVVATGPEDSVVHPAKDTAAMQMTRSTIAFGSIQKPWIPDFIKKTMAANNFARTGAGTGNPAGKTRYFIGRSYDVLVPGGIFIKPCIEWLIK
jgi:hypothetical protein